MGIRDDAWKNRPPLAPTLERLGLKVTIFRAKLDTMNTYFTEGNTEANENNWNGCHNHEADSFLKFYQHKATYINKKLTYWLGQAKRHDTRIRPKAVRGGTFGSF